MAYNVHDDNDDDNDAVYDDDDNSMRLHDIIKYTCLPPDFTFHGSKYV